MIAMYLCMYMYCMWVYMYMCMSCVSTYRRVLRLVLFDTISTLKTDISKSKWTKKGKKNPVRQRKKRSKSVSNQQYRSQQKLLSCSMEVVIKYETTNFCDAAVEKYKGTGSVVDWISAIVEAANCAGHAWQVSTITISYNYYL